VNGTSENSTNYLYTCVNGTLDFYHNLISARTYGIYVCAPHIPETVNGTAFYNKLYIRKNIFANFKSYELETPGYAVYLCDRDYLNIQEDYQRNIHIKNNLIYKVPNGIYIGYGNRDITVKGNTIAVMVPTDLYEFRELVDEWFNQALDFATNYRTIPGQGSMIGIGIDMPKGANKSIGIGFNYIFYGNRGIRIIGWPSAEWVNQDYISWPSYSMQNIHNGQFSISEGIPRNELLVDGILDIEVINNR